MLSKLFTLAAALSSPSVLALVPAPPRDLLLPVRPDIVTPELKLNPTAGIHFLDCQPREDAVLSARQTEAPEPSWLSILIVRPPPNPNVAGLTGAAVLRQHHRLPRPIARPTGERRVRQANEHDAARLEPLGE